MNLDLKGRVVTLEQAERLAEQDLFSSALLSMSETVSHLPEVVLDQEAGERIVHGREVALPPLALGSLEDQSPVRLCGQTGSLIAVGVCDFARRTVKPEVVLQPQGV
jgi:tRNA U55 pseudouridine synthase TruB